MNKTYLGLDLSTQKLKAVQLNHKLEILHLCEVKFDDDFGEEFPVSGGVCVGEHPNEYYVNPRMWVKAIDLVLDRLILSGADFSTVASISGSAQQHGSVYWNAHGIETLNNLDVDKFLHNQIDEFAFAISRSPIWMDSSTTQQCEEMERAVGGRDEMVRITGSQGYERFTGAQIRKIAQNQPDVYEATERISLVSSFLASIFLNRLAPIDHSDGSGMNLLDINKREWSQKCLDACAEGLREKLGEAVPTASVIGNVGKFFVQRYKFSAECKVVAFTGDNCSALAGLNVDDDSIAFSLGTSDTIMLSLEKHAMMEHGHVLIHPTSDGKFMGLLCFKNGALVRDTFKKAEANDSWEIFSELMNLSPRGNGGYMALHYLSHEILPFVPAGALRWTPTHTLENYTEMNKIIQFPTQQIEIRALIEGQMLNRKAFAVDMGYNFGEKTKILATGGSSTNKAILQVMADVFNCAVYVKRNTTEAACLGAAYRAKYVHYRDEALKRGDTCDSYHDYINKFCRYDSLRCAANPYCDSNDIYIPMLARYREMAKLMTENGEKGDESEIN